MRKKVMGSAEGYNFYSRDYRKDHEWLDSFDAANVADYMTRFPDGPALEAGCGDGRILRRLKKSFKDVTGLDCSSRILDECRKRVPGANLVLGDAESMPFPDQTFQSVSAVFLLVHLKTLSYFFHEAFRVLVSGGMFCANNLAESSPPVLRNGKKKYVIRSFSHQDKEIMDTALEAGFIFLDSRESFHGNVKISALFLFQRP